MPDLRCTCIPGESVTGTRQEIIEQRLALLFELSVPEVHALLDLMDVTLDAILELPAEERDEGMETARRMAETSGRTVGWVGDFLTTWEFVSDEACRETHVPWNGALGKGRTE